MGINSFKIEGRMKSPTYVATVTKIYRKYIDLVLTNINLNKDFFEVLINTNLVIKDTRTDLSDREELLQVFNRGGFSTGHFSPDGNKELIFKDKPNNMGIYIGVISHFNQNKGYITLKLEDTISIGDKISINNESYVVSELMLNNENYETVYAGKIVKLGRVQGNIYNGLEVYRIENARLNKLSATTFKENKELKKVKIFGKLTIKKDMPITLKVWSKDGFYDDLETTVTKLKPEIAQNIPVTKEKLYQQISKTGNTEFEFENIDIELDNNLFVPIIVLNELRREALQNLENKLINKYTNKIELKENSKLNIDLSKEKNKKVGISLLINNFKYDYSNLENIDKLYIPLKYFLDKKYEIKLQELVSKFNTYLYMPSIVKDKNNIDFKYIIKKFNIKGFIISHISQIEKLKEYNLELISNFTLNIYNNYSIKALKEFGISTFTISPEMSKLEVKEMFKKSEILSEIIVYGKIPVMTNNYCYLGKSNKCYKECKQKCKSGNIFFLKDRMNFDFRIVPDNSSTITTIYNSKTLFIKYTDIKTDFVRIDILDETLEEIQKIIDTVKKRKPIRGQRIYKWKILI